MPSTPTSPKTAHEADTSDTVWMQRALALARRGLFTTTPNPRVGCVLVKNGRIVGEGWHVEAGKAHAEVNAIADAQGAAHGSMAYVTLEPCCHQGRTGPCTDALRNAGVTAVVAAMLDPNPRVAGQGLTRLRDAGIAVRHGVLDRQARKLNPGFISRMTTGRPFVRCKLASSLDGRTALANGDSQWITGAEARADVQRMRARACAIVTGSGTVISDDPALTVRIPEAAGRQPLRVVLDSSHRLSPRARLFDTLSQVLLVGTQPPSATYLRQLPAHAQVLTLSPHTSGTAAQSSSTGVNLARLMAELGRREINEVHLECGAQLAGAFLQAGLIDELAVYMAPVIMGDSARGLFHLPELTDMAQRIPFHLLDMCRVGADWKMLFAPAGPNHA